jgi:hypothetical protein
MTRLFLAAGVAALAITVPATAKPDRHDRDSGHAAKVERGGGQRAQATQQRRGGGHAQQIRQRGGAQRVAAVERRAQHSAQQKRVERRTERVAAKPHRAERMRSAERREVRHERNDRRDLRVANRQQQVRANRVERRVDNRALARQELRADRRFAANVNRGQGYGIGGCPPGLADKGCMPPGQALKGARIANADAFRASRLGALAFSPRTRFVDPLRATRVIGLPLRTASTILPLSVLPQSVSYLYPDTPDYYYRDGSGYLYEVDRDTNLIASLLPLIAGGYMPGSYLPSAYMNSYAPNYYGFNSFYPASYGYGGNCNRYANGVVYQVDCVTGLVENVVPLYASGYGVGQFLPSSYGYYNVPYQYRSMYYNTPDYNYWYAPGAIYQYDPSSSLITSVAALLSPGFAVGQPMPLGYNAYNVPYAYRATYYDTPNAWYRYNNGYIYQVDPTTQLVSAIVASILT